MPRKFNQKNKILFILILILVYIGLLEVSLRILFPIPEILNFNRINYSYIIHTPNETPRYLSNAAFTWSSEPDSAEFVNNLNLYGFRDKNWRIKHKEGFQRVIFIGDSFVEGFMATGDETIPIGFEKAASSKKLHFEVLNFGVGASQLPHYCKLIVDAVPLFKPDYLFLVFFANDFFNIPEFQPLWLSPSFSPEYIRVMTPRLYSLIDYMRTNRTIPRRWRSDPFPFIASVPDSRNPWSSNRKAKSFEQFVVPRIAEAMKRGRFNSYAVNYYSLAKLSLLEPFDIRKYLKGIRGFLEDHSCKLFLAYIPNKLQISDSYLPSVREYDVNKNPTSLMDEKYHLHAQLLNDQCKQLDIPFLDTTNILRDHEARGTRLFWEYDDHMKGQSYLFVGQYLFNWFEHELERRQNKEGE